MAKNVDTTHRLSGKIVSVINEKRGLAQAQRSGDVLAPIFHEVQTWVYPLPEGT